MSSSDSDPVGNIFIGVLLLMAAGIVVSMILPYDLKRIKEEDAKAAREKVEMRILELQQQQLEKQNQS